MSKRNGSTNQWWLRAILDTRIPDTGKPSWRNRGQAALVILSGAGTKKDAFLSTEAKGHLREAELLGMSSGVERVIKTGQAQQMLTEDGPLRPLPACMGMIFGTPPRLGRSTPPPPPPCKV